jgi:hypothetical protein
MPVFRRYGRPGLLEVIGSSAIVSGSPATIARVIDHVSPGADEQSIATELRMLTALHEAGHLSGKEFTSAKTRLLST